MNSNSRPTGALKPIGELKEWPSGKFADEVLVADVRFVLDQLQEMNSQDRFWHGHLDLSKIGIVGHSMGGTTAALATQKEPGFWPAPTWTVPPILA
jgi:dienelactone hydrolase